MKNFSNTYYKIYLPIISIFLFFIILEFVCRIFNLTNDSDLGFKFYIRNVDNDIRISYINEDPLFMWSLVPNYDDGLVKINSKGFRDKEYSVSKDKNTFRMLVLGDSSTFGVGVNSFTKTYHSLLEEKLNKSKDSDKNYEIINGGVTGYTSSQGLNIYKHKFAKYEPDVVTFYFGINEVISRFYMDDKQIMRVNKSNKKEILIGSILGKLESYRLLSKITLNIKTRFLGKVPRVSLEDYGKNIIEMNEICKKNGSRFLLISPLLRNQGYEDMRKQKIIIYRKKLEDISKKHNIPLLTIELLTEKSNVSNAQFFSDSVHPNEQGNIVLMEALRYYLKVYKKL